MADVNHPFQRLLCKLGTLAHNRTFSALDVSEYVGVDGAAAVKKLTRLHLVKKVGARFYYPTAKGWDAIERACRR
jgi:hypothetical protein